MSYVLHIAGKHLMKRCHSGFISFGFIVSILGVAVGVMALIVVLSVMSGFDQELKSKIVGVQPHIIVEQVGGIDDAAMAKKTIDEMRLPAVQSVAPFVQGQAIIRSGSYASGVVIKGIDTAAENLEMFKKNMRLGELDFHDMKTGEGGRKTGEKEGLIGRIMIGEELAQVLNVGIGDVATIISPATDGKSFSSILKKPVMVSFVVGGIFRVGMSDFDSALVLMSVGQGQALYRLGGRVTGMSIRLSDIEQAEEIKWQIRGRFDSTYIVRSWMDLNRNFFSALKVEKAVMTILLSLIILVAGFTIVATLTMVVMEKTRDIGILRALGATAGKIGQIFLVEGFLIGVGGVVLGACAGLALAFHLNPVADFLERYTGLSVFPRDIYFFDQIPVQIHFDDVWLIAMSALVMSVLAGLYPAYQAACLKPVEAIRYE